MLPLVDTEQENIKAHFATSAEFIKNAIDSGGKVLVHWLSSGLIA